MLLRLPSAFYLANNGNASPGLAGSDCDFNNDGSEDLVVGADSKGLPGKSGAGTVSVIYGSSAGLNANGSQLWTQDVPGLVGVAEQADNFGNQIACGDFDNDGYSDLVVTIRGEDFSGKN